MKLLPFICLFILTACSSGHHQKREFPPQTRMKLCFMGDSGLDSPTQKITADALAEEACHEVYVLGDVIYPSGLIDQDDTQSENKFFKHYRRVYERDHRPRFHILLGNHDYRGSPDAWIEIAKTNPMIYAPSRYYFEEFNGVCIASLDTNLPKFFFEYPKHHGQKSWLDDFEDRLKDHCPVKIALGHHPYLNSGTRHGHTKGTVKTFLEDYVIGTFDYYLAGHEHALSYEGKQKQTELYISGAAGNPNPGQLPGYITMEIEKVGTEFKVVTSIKRVKNQKTVIELQHSKVFTSRK